MQNNLMNPFPAARLEHSALRKFYSAMFDDTGLHRQTSALAALGSFGLARALTLVTLACLMVLLVVAGIAQLVDPFLRNDDFPALLRDGETYYEKTLQEGRWLTYWWHLRPFGTPASFNHIVFLLGSALYAAALALHALGIGRLMLATLAASLAALSPQAVLMAGWFNTLIPGMWLVAIYAVLTLRLGLAGCRWLLFVFVPLTLIAYSTYPLLMLLVCLVHRKAGRSTFEIAKTLVAFGTAFALGLVVMFGLNWMVHGVFGLEYVHWRDANPANDLAGLVENLPLLAEFFTALFYGLGFGHAWFATVNIAAFLAALAIISRRKPVEAMSISTAVFAGLALLSILSLKDGVFILFRATQFVWAAYAIALTRAAVHLAESGANAGRSLSVAIAAIVAISAMFGAKVYRNNLPFQIETRRIAESIPDDVQEVRILGEYYFLPEAVQAFLQHDFAIRDRIAALTGLHAVSCASNPDDCVSPAPPDVTHEANDRTVIETRDGIAYVFLPGAGRQ